MTLDEFLIGRQDSADQKKINKQTKEQMLEMLRTLTANFFVDPTDIEWMNRGRYKQFVKHCIKESVAHTTSSEEVKHSDTLLAIWRQMFRDPSVLEYVKYLFDDLL